MYQCISSVKANYEGLRSNKLISKQYNYTEFAEIYSFRQLEIARKIDIGMYDSITPGYRGYVELMNHLEQQLFYLKLIGLMLKTQIYSERALDNDT